MYKFSKYFLLLLMIAGFSVSAKAQSFSIVGLNDMQFKANINDEWDILLNSDVQSLVFSDINVKVKVTALQVPEGHSFDVCWNGNCLPPTTTDWDLSTAAVLKANSSLGSGMFFSHYYCQWHGSDPVAGVGKLLYTFYNVDNPEDKAELTATFTFDNGEDVSEFVSFPELNINVSNDNILNVTSTNVSEQYQLNVIDISGNKVLNTGFSSLLTQNLNNLPAGAYLFSITNKEGNKVSTGKMIIK